MAWPPPPPRPPVGPPSTLPPPPAPDGIGWALVPLLTIGLGAPIAFLYAAARRRSAALGLSAAVYGAGLAASYAELVTGDSGDHLLGLLLLILTWVISTAHAMIARPRLYPPVNPRDQHNRYAVEIARHRRILREAARKIVADDPGLAHELRIGRPDMLPRAYDDGGLIDVNHASPQALMLLPGLTYEMVDRILRIRAEQGGFISAEELALHADLPPAIVPGLAEYGIFMQ